MKIIITTNVVLINGDFLQTQITLTYNVHSL